MHQTAAKYGIKHVFSGGNYATEGILPRVWGYHGMKDMRLYNHIVKKYGKIKRKKTPKFGIWEEFYYKFFKGIRMSYVLNYVNYDKSSAQQELINKYGIHPFDRKHSESIYTSFFQVYVMPVKYGFDYRRATYASQICSGKLTREEAILLLSQPSYDSSSMEEDKAYICKKLGLHLSEFDSLMNASPLTYRDFPNSEKWIEFVHSVYKKLYPKK